MNELQPNNPEMGIKDFATVLRRRFWVILPILLLCVAGAYFVTMGVPGTSYKGIPKAYRAESELEVIQRVQSSGNDPTAGAGGQTTEPIETEMALIQNREMERRTAAKLKNEALAKDPTVDTSTLPTPEEIEAAIKVTNPTDSNLLVVTADANSPVQAQSIANAVANAFVVYKRDLATKDMENTVQSLDRKVKIAMAAMNSAQQAETKFKQDNHLSNVDAEEKEANDQLYNSTGQVSILHQRLASLTANRIALDARLQAADAAVHAESGVPDEAQVQNLQGELDRLKAQRQEAGAQYTYDFPGAPNMPSLRSLDAQIAVKQKQFDAAKSASTSDAAPSLAARSALVQLDQDAHTQEGNAQQELAAAVQTSEAYRQQVEGMPLLQQRYKQLSLNDKAATDLYQNLYATRNATRLQRDLVSGNVTITQYADPPRLPYKPDLKTNLVLGLALGALISLGLVMLLEQTDQRVRTLDEVRALVSGPIIGMLPQTSRGQMKSLAEGRLLPQFEEAFSLVRVNLSYVMRHSMMRDQAEHQTILVTSAVPGEGKSVAAAELARSMAEAGKSVILVDANLRRPSQNILFQTGETGGLTDVLSGQLPLDEAIATSNVENLSILNSGVSSQNPTVLLSQPRLASVMEALRFKADVVIIDAPDCTSVADTLLLTAHADCLLQVVRAGMVNMETLHNASAALHATGKKVTVLANGLTRPQQRAFRSRFAYAALSSQSETPALPQTFEKTMVMNRSRDLIFSKSAHKSLDNPEGTPDKNEA